jgi:hypothetical protein
MQKKILLVIFISSFVTAVHAQIKKGAIFLGGNIGFSIQDSKTTQATAPGFDDKNTYVSISPVFGKAIKDNLILGADIIWSYSKVESSLQKTHAYGAGVFIRKYKELGKGFYVFGQTRIGGSYNSLENGYTNNQASSYDKTTGYSAAINIYPGVSYSISRKLQLETGFNNLAYLSFDHSKRIENFNGGVSVVSNTFGLGSSLSSLSGFTLGFRVLID